MARHAFADWNLPDGALDWHAHVQVALLMDIRDLLKVIRDNTNPLRCNETRKIPRLLTKIASNTDRFKCQVHKRYKGILPPRTDCKDCRRMYRRRNA
jgi:hypothetical protein